MQINDARDWMQSYYASPKFEERYNRMINDGTYKSNWLSEAAERRGIGAILNGRLKWMDIIPAQVAATRFAFDPTKAGAGSRYFRHDNLAIIDPKTDIFRARAAGVGHNTGSTTVHEIAHMDTTALMSPKQIDRMRRGLRPLKDRNLDFRHVEKPHEARADIQGMRYVAARLGIYDARTENFTKEHLKALFREMTPDQRPLAATFYRMLQTYDEDTLIWMMNNLAQNDSKEGPSNPIPDNYA
jgi:hypothetical protein